MLGAALRLRLQTMTMARTRLPLDRAQRATARRVRGRVGQARSERFTPSKLCLGPAVLQAN